MYQIYSANSLDDFYFENIRRLVRIELIRTNLEKQHKIGKN